MNEEGAADIDTQEHGAIKIFLTELEELPPDLKHSDFKKLEVADNQFTPTVLPWGTTALVLRQYESVYLKGEEASMQRSHLFLNSGPGAVSCIAFSGQFTYEDEIAVLFMVSKSFEVHPLKEKAVRSGDNSLVQFWKYSPSRPEEFKLVGSEQTPHIRSLQFVDQAAIPTLLPSLLILRENGSCELFELIVEPDRCALGRRLWDVGSLVRCAESTSVMTLDCHDEALLLLIGIGTREGSIIVVYLAVDHDSRRVTGVAEVSREQIYVTDSAITSLCWMPDGKGTFFAAGTCGGTLLLCDKRNPLSPCLITHEFNNRRINKISWSDSNDPIALAQFDGVLYAPHYTESSRHAPSRLYNDIKVGKRKEEKGEEGAGLACIDLFLPTHRRQKLGKAIEQPCKDVAVLNGRGLFGFEDGSCLLGDLKDMDRKLYKGSGILSWSLVSEDQYEPIQVFPGNKDETLLEGSMKLLSRHFQRGYELACRDGVHILTSSYYPLAMLLKEFARGGSMLDDTQYCPAYEILAISSVCAASLPKWGDDGVFAYATTLGVVHILSSSYFDQK